jgi:hypothetical protein
LYLAVDLGTEILDTAAAEGAAFDEANLIGYIGLEP